MQDGRIWMVQDMKFGDKCAKENFNCQSCSYTQHVSTSFPSHYGDCAYPYLYRTDISSVKIGYYYDAAAALNRQDAAYGGGTFTCTDATCRGICPVGWHVPSRAEFTALVSSGTQTQSLEKLLFAENQWHGIPVMESSSYASLSSYYSMYYWARENGSPADRWQYVLSFALQSSSASTSSDRQRYYGTRVRCIKNQ
jgi:uncharacterized protein (TIGR02145 family)